MVQTMALQATPVSQAALARVLSSSVQNKAAVKTLRSQSQRASTVPTTSIVDTLQKVAPKLTQRAKQQAFAIGVAALHRG